MNRIRDIKGVTLVELMVTLAIFSIIFGMIYSVYNSFLRQATIERKSEKTELDIVQTSWSMIKTIENAGFGIPQTGPCAYPIQLQSGELIIHTQAVGADRYAGRWSRIEKDCSVPNLSDLQDNEWVVILTGEDKKLLGYAQISGGKITPCNPTTHGGQFAYRVPDNTFGCYEIRYQLTNYNSGRRPTMCENTGAMVLRRSLSTSAQPVWNPFIDCVYPSSGFNVRFGCIDSNGNLTWRIDPNCGLSKLRLIKLGILIQSSPRKDIQGPPSITLFEDLEPSLRATINLTNEQRFYRWKKLEQTIILRNPE
jgi:prepilin-type N-terminal cleavage/methylation domain-containing protein